MAMTPPFRSGNPTSVENNSIRTNRNDPNSNRRYAPTSNKNSVILGEDHRWTYMPSTHDVYFGRVGIKHAGTRRWREDVVEAWKAYANFSDKVVAYIREKDNGRRYWICPREDSKMWVEATPKQIQERLFQ